MKQTAILTWILTALLLLSGGVMSGCSTEENPITPEKMSEIRKKEANERANFNPSTNTPKPGN